MENVFSPEGDGEEASLDVREKQTTAADLAASWRAIFPERDLDGFFVQLFAVRLGMLFAQDQERSCRDRFGLTASHLRVLAALFRQGPPYELRPGNLHRNLLISAGAVTKQVDRLIAEGLVERHVHPRSGREALVRLTKRGEQVVREAIDIRIADPVVGDALNALDPAERVALVSGLRRLAAALEFGRNSERQ